MLRLQPSSLTKVMRYFGIPARFSRLTARLGESRRPSSRWIVFRTTSSSRGSTLLDSSPPSSAGDTLGMSFMAKYLPVSPPPAVSRVDPVSLSPPFHGGSGGALAPSDRRLSRFSTSLSEVCVLRGGVLNSIPSLKNTPHHALAISSHRLKMGGTPPPVAVSLLCPFLPQWGMGGNMPVAVAL